MQTFINVTHFITRAWAKCEFLCVYVEALKGNMEEEEYEKSH